MIIRPEKLSIWLVIISAWILFTVHFLQHFMDLHPCILCLWQRYPYYIILFGAVLVPLHKEILSLWMQKIALVMGMGIALYHSGMERRLWGGGGDCSSLTDPNASLEDMLLQIQQADLVKCDQINFSVLGLSLSNYNFIICLLLLVGTLYLYKKWMIDHEKQG